MTSPSVDYAQAAQLSHCMVLPSLFDSLVTDNFLRLAPRIENVGDCSFQTLITDADKPTGIDFVESGGAVNTDPVGYSANTDILLNRIATRATVSGDIYANVSQIHDILEDQALAMAQLVAQRVGEVLWSPTLPANVSSNMAEFATANPAGVGSPVQGVGSPMKLPDDLLCLREKQSPWTPSSPQYYVMNSQMYYNVLAEAWATGTGLVEFRPDAATGETMAHFADVPLVATDHISLDEEGQGTTSLYLVRVGQGASDPQKIRGFSLITSAERPGIEIGSARPNDEAADEYFMEVSWNVGFTNGSRSSVVRTAGFAP